MARKRQEPERPPQARETTIAPLVPGGRGPIPDELRPVGKRGDGGFVFELDATWADRLERLARPAGATPASYLLTLLRKAWTSQPRSLRGEGNGGGGPSSLGGAA